MSDVLTTLNDNSNNKPENIIVVKKRIKVPGAGHGGAWKIAYADFVTAMMAFFLLLWILNSVADDQKKGLVQYFHPPNPASVEANGVGLSLKGLSPTAKDQNFTSDSARENPTVLPTMQKALPQGNENQKRQSQPSGFQPNTYQQEVIEKVKQAVEQIKQSVIFTKVPDVPNINLSSNTRGVRIDVIPQHGKSLFRDHSIMPTEATSHMLALIGSILAKISNPVVVITHGTADSNKGSHLDKWTFSGMRGLYIRDWIEQGGLSPDRLNSTVTYADHNLLYKKTPLTIENERISILIQY